MSTLSLSRLRPDDRLQQALPVVFWLFVGAIGFSLGGTLLLKLAPGLMEIFGPYYAPLVKIPTWTYMALLPVLAVLMYTPALGWPRMAFFVIWGCLVGGLSELVGTATGIPFGTYQYTNWLGPKMMGHVPYFIPPSWFALSIISLDLAQRVVRHRTARILVGTLFMVLWDVSLDPAMNHAFPFWVYPDGGFFYGMPLSNWGGWLLVSLIIMTGYEVLGGGLNASHAWAPRVYLLNCLFPLLLSLLYGLHGAVLLGALATALPFIALHLRRRTAPITASC